MKFDIQLTIEMGEKKNSQFQCMDRGSVDTSVLIRQLFDWLIDRAVLYDWLTARYYNPKNFRIFRLCIILSRIKMLEHNNSIFKMAISDELLRFVLYGRMRTTFEHDYSMQGLHFFLVFSKIGLTHRIGGN